MKKRRRTGQQLSFTLIELLVVIAVIVVLTGLLVPAFTALRTSDQITNTAYTIVSTLEQARTHALASNTYVWVGFYEEDAVTTTPSASPAPYPGKGRVILATVASADGTSIFDENDPSAPLPPNRIITTRNLIKLTGVHITDIGAPAGGNAGSLDDRPDYPYTDNSSLGADHFNRISSDSADTTKFIFTVQDYTFRKTVRFNPRGEANINSTYGLKRAAEIGLKPAHGNVVDNASRNVVAIQFGGVAGNFRIYRR